MKESLSWPEKGGREGRDGGAVHHRRVCCFGLAQPHTPFILVSESVPFSPILTPFVKLIGIGAVMERLELLMLQLHLRCSRGSCCHCLGWNPRDADHEAAETERDSFVKINCKWC
ncbi:uncharacterized protein LOC107608803 [Arachis ipaensis]|uniref:uncharacterized protein LOC107608803 n=1 Tax=Arachis ipaensis TaxID=130454 RepID=UPI000A2B86C3|nr:uncharacterized protein LOC107608803 [Arachis ipaensis]XP_029150514.1 uncharacterized protein LOC112764839 [Arachis hypogaea]